MVLKIEASPPRIKEPCRTWLFCIGTTGGNSTSFYAEKEKGRYSSPTTANSILVHTRAEKKIRQRTPPVSHHISQQDTNHWANARGSGKASNPRRVDVWNRRNSLVSRMLQKKKEAEKIRCTAYFFPVLCRFFAFLRSVFLSSSFFSV